MSGKIFISYRRDDSAAMAGRLCDHLQKRFSKKKIFYDIDSIDPGEDFEIYIKGYIQKSNVLLAVIGPDWLQCLQSNLDKTTDFVRIEIATALENKIKVIPVLLGDTDLPSANELPENLQDLIKKNAFTIRHVSFNQDVEILSRHIKKYVQEKSDYRKLLKPVSICIAAVLIALSAWFLLAKKETKPNYRNITQINSQEPVFLIDWCTYQFVFTEPKHPTSIPLAAYTVLSIIRENDDKEDPDDVFCYLIKPDTPSKLHLKLVGSKLYVNQKLKAICINGIEKVPDLINEEITSLETISIIATDLNDTLYNDLVGILQTNPRISIIDQSFLDIDIDIDKDEQLPMSESTYQLMKMTFPELLVCNTSFPEIATLNLSSVRSAIIRGTSNTPPNFYKGLYLPNLKTLTSVEAETDKIFLRDSVESITFLDDHNFNSFASLKNKDKIKQLQVIFTDKNKDKIIDFAPLKDYKKMKSFGYYAGESRKDNVVMKNVASIKDMSELTLSNVRLKDVSLLAEKNPALQQLTISFSDTIKNLDWASAFTHLKSLSLDITNESIFENYEEVKALSKLPELEYFSANCKLERGSIAYKNLMEACPKCNIYRWGLCLGSGWILLFLPVIVIFYVIKTMIRQRALNGSDINKFR